MTAAPCGEGVAAARAAIAGNPSDGYGGAVLAVTLPGLVAQARVTERDGAGPAPDASLVEATLRRASRELGIELDGAAIEWRTTIPRGVGLGGSSAIVIATIRALLDHADATLDPDALAELALSVEVDELGIVAGPQDRVAQAYGGLVFMDFAPEHADEPYELLDEALLPELLVAWRPDAAAESGRVHADLRARFRREEPDVLDAIQELADCAHGARGALLAGDHHALGRCVDATFDLRRQILSLDPRCVEMIQTARAAGACANYTGSGGAIVALCPSSDGALDGVERALRQIGCETLRRRRDMRSAPPG